jgi:hypothetical protein
MTGGASKVVLYMQSIACASGLDLFHEMDS